MPLAGVAGSNRGRTRSGARSGPRGSITPGKAFNHLPQLIAAFPHELSAIVAETTDDLGILSSRLAPVQKNPRRGDPTPGTLQQSAKTKIYYRRASDPVVTGRVDFNAKDRRGHRYARPVESGSDRKRGRRRSGRTAAGIRSETRVRAQPFLVDSLVTLRPVFIVRLAGLEARLPR